MTAAAGIGTEEQQALSIVFNGHVDHGKSTLIGRLLAELGIVQPSRITAVEAICKEKNMKFEYAFLLDAFEEEQDQGITIDVSQVRFRSKKRRPYRIIDAPGHKEFLKNMISGASTADVSILMIDAEEGVREQSHRHATILSLLGIKTIIVVVNKMDLMDYKEEVFERIKTEYSKHLASLKLTAHSFIPMAAYLGENLVNKSDKMPWYAGKSFLETLDALETPRLSEDRPLRFPLQDVYKFDNKRVYAGRIESGALEVGEEVVFLPSGTKTRVRSIEKWHASAQTRAAVGESIGLTLDDPVFAERGEMIVRAASAPQVGTSFVANIFWMGGEHLERGAKYTLKITTEEVECVVESILKVINSSTLEEAAGVSKAVAKNEVAEIILRTKKPIAFDSFDEITSTGRFVLAARQQILGGGIILKKVEHFSAI